MSQFLEFSEFIKKERKKLDLVPKNEIVKALEDKINEVTGVIPDTIRLIALKALDDLTSCSTEQQLMNCLKQWAEVTVEQNNLEIQYFMNGIGSILMRVDLSSSCVKVSNV